MDSRCSVEGEARCTGGGVSFSAASGPLPPTVIDAVAAACHGTAQARSILSLPFTSPQYKTLQADVDARLRRLLDIPAHFRVLFVHGGASAQFAMVPLNLMGEGGRAVYVDTGHWSRRAAAEAARYGRIIRIGTSDAPTPDAAEWPIGPDAAYCHITTNETADGRQFHALPAIDVPLVADMTSDFLTRPLDFSRLALGYAATQKTIGVPGLTVVIVREDLLGGALPITPKVMNYAAQAEADSRLNTPPVFPMQVAQLMLQWIEAKGGVPAMAAQLERRSAAVYGTLEANEDVYRLPVGAAQRSRVNPCFQLANEALTARFLDDAAAAGLHDLRGHPQTGGVRVSLYNGLDEAAVAALIHFLDDFAQHLQ